MAGWRTIIGSFWMWLSGGQEAAGACATLYDAATVTATLYDAAIGTTTLVLEDCD